MLSRSVKMIIVLSQRCNTTKKGLPYGSPFYCVQLANAVELQGKSALLVSGVVLVKNTLCGSLIDRLHCDLVSALGLGAIAFCGSSLELLDGGLECGLVGLIAGVADLSDQHALLGGLNIRQTKHLLRLEMYARGAKSTVQNCILAEISRNCKHFFNIFCTFLHFPKLCAFLSAALQDVVFIAAMRDAAAEFTVCSQDIQTLAKIPWYFILAKGKPTFLM